MASANTAPPTVLSRRKQEQGVPTSSQDHGTKSDFLKNPQAGSLPTFPGEYQLEKLHLLSPNRRGYVDLKAAWSDLNIYEDLFGSYLTGNIQILDGVGLMESVPIIGEETLHVIVKTKGLTRQRNSITIPGPFEGSENEGLMDLKFRIVKILNITKLNEGMLTYKLSFVSEEAILNIKQKVRKSALDPISLAPRKISDVVKSLYRQFFQQGRQGRAKRIFIEPTKNQTDLIIPNQTPFKAFEFLASRAISAGKQAVGSSFVFYETTRGFFFISMETLMSGGGMGYSTVAGAPGSPTELVYTAPEEPIKEVYVIQPKRLGAQTAEVKNIAIEMTAVDAYSFSSNFDVLENLTSGMYANRLLTHDLVRMRYDTLDFNLVDPASLGTHTTIDENSGSTEVVEFLTQSRDAKNFTDSFSHLGTGKLATEKQDALGSPESVMAFYPTNFAHDIRFKTDIGSAGVHGEVKGDLNIQPSRVEQWMQSRLVQNQQANNIKLNIRAPGLSTRSVGDLIEFKLPTTYLEDRDGITQSQNHTYLSGYYLITKLRHHFTKERYDIEFEAIKDSLKVSPGIDRAVPEADVTSSSTQTAEEFTNSRVADFNTTGDTSRGF